MCGETGNFIYICLYLIVDFTNIIIHIELKIKSVFGGFEFFRLKGPQSSLYGGPTLKKHLVKMKMEPTGRSASKMTDVRNTPVLSVKDQHCIQTTRVICYIIVFINSMAILTALP